MKSPVKFGTDRTAAQAEPGRSGFTLIEIAAVVAILGMMISLLVFKMDSITPATRLRAAARTVGSAVELAQSEAAMKGEARSVVYDMRKGTIEIQKEMPDEETGTRTIMTKVLPDDVTITAIEGLTVEHDMATLRVHPSGRTSPHVIRLNNAHGDMTVEAYGITGRIAYREGFVEAREFTKEATDE